MDLSCKCLYGLIVKQIGDTYELMVRFATGVRWPKLLFTYIDMCIGSMVDSVLYGVMMNDDT